MLRRARNFDSFVDLRETISASRIVDRRKGEGWFGKVPGITGKRQASTAFSGRGCHSCSVVIPRGQPATRRLWQVGSVYEDESMMEFIEHL